ncbi:hypothetical protein QUF64_05790 [Anaerolineales bacterium HSG6]|nr:hypothetical protein [Anaerolineales bacterium HSG6]
MNYELSEANRILVAHLPFIIHHLPFIIWSDWRSYPPESFPASLADLMSYADEVR